MNQCMKYSIYFYLSFFLIISCSDQSSIEKVDANGSSRLTGTNDTLSVVVSEGDSSSTTKELEPSLPASKSLGKTLFIGGSLSHNTNFTSDLIDFVEQPNLYCNTFRREQNEAHAFTS